MGRRQGAAAVSLLAAVAIAAGCGGSDGSGTGAADESEPLPIPACAKAGAPAPRSAELPADFPLPPGTVVTSTASPYEGQVLVGGVIPADLEDAAAFFSDRLPERGYQLGLFDSEQGEAEAPFTGHGYRGKWKVNSILDCPNAVTLTLVLIAER